jgi:hypothetical protein
LAFELNDDLAALLAVRAFEGVLPLKLFETDLLSKSFDCLFFKLFRYNSNSFKMSSLDIPSFLFELEFCKPFFPGVRASLILLCFFGL